MQCGWQANYNNNYYYYPEAAAIGKSLELTLGVFTKAFVRWEGTSVSLSLPTLGRFYKSFCASWSFQNLAALAGWPKG